MLNITRKTSDKTLTIFLDGRLDTTTAPDLESELKQSLPGMTDLVFDMTSLEYLSSAGLRVLLAAKKMINKQGMVKVTNVSPTIMDVLEVTGFADILNVE